MKSGVWLRHSSHYKPWAQFKLYGNVTTNLNSRYKHITICWIRLIGRRNYEQTQMEEHFPKTHRNSSVVLSLACLFFKTRFVLSAKFRLFTIPTSFPLQEMSHYFFFLLTAVTDIRMCQYYSSVKSKSNIKRLVLPPETGHF